MYSKIGEETAGKDIPWSFEKGFVNPISMNPILRSSGHDPSDGYRLRLKLQRDLSSGSEPPKLMTTPLSASSNGKRTSTNLSLNGSTQPNSGFHTPYFRSALQHPHDKNIRKGPGTSPATWITLSWKDQALASTHHTSPAPCTWCLGKLFLRMKSKSKKDNRFDQR